MPLWYGAGGLLPVEKEEAGNLVNGNKEVGNNVDVNYEVLSLH